MNIDEIKKSLEYLEKIYNEKIQSNDDGYEINLICKSATLELCGWVEETHDNLFLNLVNSIVHKYEKIKNDFCACHNENAEKFCFSRCFDNQCVKGIYGLSYHDHFRKMLISTFGFFIAIEIEHRIGFDKISTLSYFLDNLHKQRNILAHNTYSSTLQNDKARAALDAPSTTLRNLENISAIFSRVETVFKEQKIL